MKFLIQLLNSLIWNPQGRSIDLKKKFKKEAGISTLKLFQTV